MENNNTPQPGEASFNQAGYSQLRLHNLFLKIDELNLNLGAWNPYFYSFNYNCIFNNLISVYLTISSKLTPEEKKEMDKKREEIVNLLSTNPPHKTTLDCYNKKISMFSKVSLESLNKLLLYYRVSLEDLMEKYKMGNPNKDSEGGFD